MEGGEVITSRYGALKRKANNFSKRCLIKNPPEDSGFFFSWLVSCLFFLKRYLELRTHHLVHVTGWGEDVVITNIELQVLLNLPGDTNACVV